VDGEEEQKGETIMPDWIDRLHFVLLQRHIHQSLREKATTDVRRVLLKDERSREKSRIDALQQMEHYWSNHIVSFRSSGYGFGKRHHQRIGTRKLKVSDSKTLMRPIKKTHPKREFAHHRTKVTNQKRNLM
jgi:hypothetical protein